MWIKKIFSTFVCVVPPNVEGIPCNIHFWILSFWKSVRKETEINTHSSHLNPHNAGMGKILNASICIQAQISFFFLKRDCSVIWNSSYVHCLRLFFCCCCLGKLQFINSNPTLTKLTESSCCNFLLLSASINICAYVLSTFMVSLTFSMQCCMFSFWVTCLFCAVHLEDLPNLFYSNFTQQSCVSFLSSISTMLSRPSSHAIVGHWYFWLVIYSRSLVILTTFPCLLTLRTWSLEIYYLIFNKLSLSFHYWIVGFMCTFSIKVLYQKYYL